MMIFNWAHYSAAFPEMFVAAMSLLLLVMGAFSSKTIGFDRVLLLSKATLLGAFIVVATQWLGGSLYAFPRTIDGMMLFNAMYVADDFALYAKGFILLSSLIALHLSSDYLKQKKIKHFEYYILHLLSVLGMMMMVSAQDMLSLYVGLEIMSFSLYILASFHRDDKKSSEAGLKYFVLGSLASCILLYGMSLFYGLSGTTSFMAMKEIFEGGLAASQNPATLSVALVLLLTGLLFKISAVPFHMWTPDVYEGAPTPVTAFMAVAPKIAAFVLLLRVLYQPLLPMMAQWSDILWILAVLTMSVGSLMAIVQTNIKRLLAYSSIAHVGFMLVGVVAGTMEGVQGVLFYLAIYAVMVLGTFALILSLRKRDVYVEKIEDLAGLGQKTPILAACFVTLMFSLAGVPPLAGFWAKYQVFAAAISTGYTGLALMGVIFSVVGAYYCLRIIQAVYFEKPQGKFSEDIPFALHFVAVATAVLVLVFGVFPSTVLDWAWVAASALF